MANDSEINSFPRMWERAALALLAFIVSCLFIFYQGQREDYKGLEEKVVTMQSSKVNKEDLKDVEGRINNKIDAMSSNLVSRSAADKADILARLDLYFSQVKNNRR
jgi:hypothetical protein